ncbi:MAG: aromatic ring-hydroxylating dioxygenase subunit alpha [Pseudomonadota bacterium]
MNSVSGAKIPLLNLESVHKPIHEANGMPNAVYREPELFAFECEQVMGKTWAGLAFVSDLPQKGYVKPIEFMGVPLLLLRNQQGDIKVVHNVCSHRGMPLVREERAVAGKMRCAYHSWTYDLNGDLKGTPHIGGVGVHEVDGFDCSEHGLKPVRMAIWMNMIFINLSGDAPTFEEHITPLLSRWEQLTGKHGLDQVQPASSGSRMEIEVKANWKLAVENYCEAYHLPVLHPGLNSYSPLNEHYNIICDDYGSGQGSYNYSLSAVAGTTLPQIAEWPEDKIRHAEYISFYPNVLLGLQADHAFAIILQPLAENKTLERLELYYVGDEALSDTYYDCRNSVLEAWQIVFSEDVFAVEGMQEGRRSPAFKGGVFSPVLEGPTHHFHGWVARKYKAAGLS